MNITIDIPIKDEQMKKILIDYLEKQADLFLSYYYPEYKIDLAVEKEILKQKNEDYVEIKNSEELLKMIS